MVPSLNPHESAPKLHLGRFSRFFFAQLTLVPNAHTDTDTQIMLRATSVATGRVYALRAGDAT